MLSTDFILPGRRATSTPYAKACLAKAFATSKSRFCNPRNIEYPWYGLWCQILMDLTSDRSRLLTIPQHLIYYTEPLEDDEDELNHDANDTISSIPSATATTPLPGAKEIIPDFAIVRIIFRWLDAKGEKVWRNVKVQRAGVPVLAEIKRAGSRSSTALTSVLWHLTVAQAASMTQAAYLFRMIPDQQSVILLACTGHWWSCRIATRDQVKNLEKNDDDISVEQDDEDMEVDDDAGYGNVTELNDNDLEQLVEESDVPVVLAQSGGEITTGPYLIEPIGKEGNLQIPCSKWTGAMRLESRVSHQMLFLIHHRLGEVVDV